MTVTGNGFSNTETLDVKIDGVACKVIYSDLHKFKCVTGAKSTPSIAGNYIGQHGLRRKFYNTSYALNWTSLASSPDYIEKLALDLEAPYNIWDAQMGNVYSGYFKPPMTGRYRFYVTCDDLCQLYLGNKTLDPKSSSKIFETPGWSNYRTFITVDGTKRTDWISLNKDDYLYIELRHV